MCRPVPTRNDDRYERFCQTATPFSVAIGVQLAVSPTRYSASAVASRKPSSKPADVFFDKRSAGVRDNLTIFSIELFATIQQLPGGKVRFFHLTQHGSDSLYGIGC